VALTAGGVQDLVGGHGRDRVGGVERQHLRGAGEREKACAAVGVGNGADADVSAGRVVGGQQQRAVLAQQGRDRGPVGVTGGVLCQCRFER
jgi:hypothetical protein